MESFVSLDKIDCCGGLLVIINLEEGIAIFCDDTANDSWSLQRYSPF